MMKDADLEANHKRAFGKRLGIGTRPALIMIDFVQAYFDKTCAIYAGVELAFALALCIQAVARGNAVPVIHTYVVYNKKSSDGGRFHQKSQTWHKFLAGSPMGVWPNGLSDADDELDISKQYPSAFFGTSLASSRLCQRYLCG
jgi:maleamate amidohydrolase